MNTRHPTNTNLTLITDLLWDKLPVQSKQGPLIKNYLIGIKKVMDNALEEHHRTCVFRVDLKFPTANYKPCTRAITAFISSLKAQLLSDAIQKQREGARLYPCTLRYVWVREQDTSSNWHYHVAIFVNKDRFNSWGRFRSAEQYTDHGDVVDAQTNMADRMRKAWASALGVSVASSIGLVHFAHSPYEINTLANDYNDQYDELFHWLSYFAKTHSKDYGSRCRHFGCSQQ